MPDLSEINEQHAMAKRFFDAKQFDFERLAAQVAKLADEVRALRREAPYVAAATISDIEDPLARAEERMQRLASGGGR